MVSLGIEPRSLDSRSSMLSTTPATPGTCARFDKFKCNVVPNASDSYRISVSLKDGLPVVREVKVYL